MSLSEKRIRVAVLFEYATLLGGERSMLACIDELQRQEAPFEFIAMAPGVGLLAKELADRNIRVIPHDGDEQRLVSAVEESRADLLHANSLSMGRLTGRIADRLAIPTLAHLRDILNLSQTAIRDLNKNCSLIAVSDATRSFHLAQGLDRDKVVVIPNGVDLSRFRPQIRSGWLHDELQLPRDCRLMATIGQIGLRKGQDVLAAAATDIVHAVPDAHFVLIGERTSTKAESIAFERSIIEAFETPLLSGRLHRLGYREDMPELISEMDLIVHPANQEPYGRVLLEAAACGVPVVATNVGGTSEIVVDGVTGLLIPPRNPSALATAVNSLLEDKLRIQSMGQAARTHAMASFDIRRAAEQLRDHWMRMLR